MPSRKVRPWFVKMGERNYLITKVCPLGVMSFFIADNTMITTGTVILTHFYNTATKKFDYGDVFIGRNVFIRCNSVVCRPIKVGDYSIVGAGSILTKIFWQSNCGVEIQQLL